MTILSNLTGFQKFSLGVGGGLIAASCAMAILFPPSATTHAPKASMGRSTEILAEILPEASSAIIDSSPLSHPVSRVETQELAILTPVAIVKPNNRGLSVAQVRQELSYDLDVVSTGNAYVPRVFLSSIPHDLGDVPETSKRKALFFKSVLPLVLQVNEEILAQRQRLSVIGALVEKGEKPNASERLWLAMMSERYNVERDDIKALLHKIDVVPPSLALAQAAKESGWGSSRFAREGNALFGQWTFAKGNLVPDGRDADKKHMIRSFGTLLDSVEAYVFNLNTHRAYREYRGLRAQMRQTDKPLDGQLLAGKLHRYSELGDVYVEAIRSMITFNKLSRFDDARLNQHGFKPEA